MEQAALDALAIPLRYARAGTSLVQAAMAGTRQCVQLEHYPRHDIVDTVHHTRLYYHAHDSRRKPDAEHGHFHLFSHGTQAGDYMHLVGISLDAVGQPIRLFTTNRWVTGEVWNDAQKVEAALARFEVKTLGRMAPVARWATAMVQLYLPQIVQLVRRRDAVMAQRSTQTDWETLWEDRRLDVVTQSQISLVQRIQQLGC
ncbi:MAG: hypothetical protein KGN32_01650 [Burkholderiales bacterium]|nr:hypothetical protein [Burkholderiales bacterium]